MSAYPLLFSEITVNRLTLGNRIVMPAMHLNYTPEGSVTDQLVEFYAERARGGAGLIIVGGCAIGPVAGGTSMISIKTDEDIPGLSRLAAAVHDNGAKVGAQLYHAGAYAHSLLTGGQAVSASDHISRFTHEEARAMTRDDISRARDEFIQAALRAQTAGFDMVEILGSAGYLICQFLSPVINKRQDEYGGSLENRMRFGLEVVAGVRQAVGPEFCVGIRIAGSDFIPGSHTNAESAGFAAACVRAGADMINVTGGWHETRVPQITAEVPAGGFAYLARGIKQAVTAPVCASNLIHDPQIAEAVLSRGDGDLVCMGRPLIADPDFPNKARQNSKKPITPCVCCNQGCFDSVTNLRPVRCMMNPRAGREHAGSTFAGPAEAVRRVIVVGGGPTGCQAALTAAARGHKVTLFEATGQLGGQPIWYCQPTRKPDFGRIAPYFTAALENSNVDLRLGRRADASMIAAETPDTVIVATGSAPREIVIPGSDLPHVVQARDVLVGKRHPRGDVVIIGGGAVGLETALFIARKGALTPEQVYFLSLYQAESAETVNTLMTRGSHRVTVLEMLPKAGQDIGRSTRWVVMGDIRRFNVRLQTGVTVSAIEENRVCFSDQEGEHAVPAGTVVMAVGAQPVDELSAELEARGIPCVVAGDAEAPSNVMHAISSGFEAANQI